MRRKYTAHENRDYCTDAIYESVLRCWRHLIYCFRFIGRGPNLSLCHQSVLLSAFTFWRGLVAAENTLIADSNTNCMSQIKVNISWKLIIVHHILFKHKEMFYTKEIYRPPQAVYYAVSNLYSLVMTACYRDMRERDKPVVLRDTKWTRSIIAFTGLHVIHMSAEVSVVVETCSWSCCKLFWYWVGGGVFDV